MKNKAFGFYTAALTLILTVATLVAVLIYGSKGGVVNSLVPIALGAAAVCEVSLLFGEKVWTDFTGIIAATLLAFRWYLEHCRSVQRHQDGWRAGTVRHEHHDGCAEPGRHRYRHHHQLCAEK